MDKAEYTVAFNFGEFNKKLKTEVQQKHSIPIAINVDKVKLKVDRQGNIIEVEGDKKNGSN